jgi:hypothetical protein
MEADIVFIKNKEQSYQVWGSHSSVAEGSTLLGSYAVLMILRSILSSSSWFSSLVNMVLYLRGLESP